MTKSKGQAVMDRALRNDQAVAKTRKHGGKQGLTMSISREALMNAVRTEGREVLTEAGSGYWNDMRRRYPHLNLNGSAPDGGDNLAGTRNRFGKVARRFTVARGWEVRVGGRWVREDGGR